MQETVPGPQQVEEKWLLPSRVSQKRMLGELGFSHRSGWGPCICQLLSVGPAVDGLTFLSLSFFFMELF